MNRVTFRVLSACAVILAATLLSIPVAGMIGAIGRADAQGTTLIVGVPEIVSNLNPFVGTMRLDHEIFTLMYERLVGVDRDLNPCPQIAESWNLSLDELVWTFDIRQGMTWHDGIAVTADDVNWTFNTIMSNSAAGAQYASYLSNVTECRVLDNYTLQITTEVPKASMLSVQIPILPKHLWENIAPNKLTSVSVFDTDLFPDGPVGSGPLVLTAYAVDSFVLLTRYAGYYGPSVQFDLLQINMYLDPLAMMISLYDGTIDIACYVPPGSWQDAIGRPSIEGQAVPEITVREFGVNVCPVDLRVVGASTNYETLNLSVRQAMRMAINSSYIVETAFLGLGDPGDVLIPPASELWHHNLTEAERFPDSIAAANDLLNNSGYTDLDFDGIRENETSGVELSFVFEYRAEYPEDQVAATLISGWLGQIGINAPPIGLLESQLFMDWIGMEYDLFIWDWEGEPDPNFLLSVMTTEQIPTSHSDWNAWSDCYYSNPYYDSLFIQQQRTINVTDRQSIVYEMQQILYEDCPYSVLGNYWGTFAYRTDEFTNWPDMTNHSGASPFTGFNGGPWLYFDIFPIVIPEFSNAVLPAIAIAAVVVLLRGRATITNHWKRP